MSEGLARSVRNAIRGRGETLSLIQTSAGTWTTATQTMTTGTLTTTSTMGIGRLMVRGIDGDSVRAGDMEVWMSKLDLDAASVTPTVGNHIILGTTKLVLLEVSARAPAGYYYCRARAAG